MAYYPPPYPDAVPPPAPMYQAVPPGTYPPGAYPADAYPPGAAYPPGVYPPGAYPPDAYPPGAYPPDPAYGVPAYPPDPAYAGGIYPTVDQPSLQVYPPEGISESMDDGASPAAAVDKEKWELVVVFPNKDNEQAPDHAYLREHYKDALPPAGAPDEAAQVSHQHSHGSLGIFRHNHAHFTRGALRQAITKRLEAVGLWTITKNSRDGKNLFLLINASQDLLETIAENVSMELRLKPKYGGGHAPFSVEKKEFFFGSDTPEGLFTKTMRQNLIEQLIEEDLEDGGAGVDFKRLENDDVIVKYYPLHSDKIKRELMSTWVLRRFTESQPINFVREYFGESLAFYFSYLEFYTKWLVFASVVGLIAFILANTLPPGQGEWANSVYAVFIALWSSFYLESWKRKRNIQAWDWGMWDFSSKETSRPGFHGTEELGTYVGNVWVKLEAGEQYGPRPPRPTRHFSLETIRMRFAFALTIVTLMCMLVIIATISILTLRIFLSSFTGYASVVGSILNAVTIQGFNKIYRGIAYKMTDFENPRTDTDYNDSLLLKLFLFQFVNSYTSMYYIAFFKRGLTLWGDDKLYDHCTYSQDQDRPGDGVGCPYELTLQLVIILATKIALGPGLDAVLPWVQYKIALMRGNKDTAAPSSALLDPRILDPSQAKGKLPKVGFGLFNGKVAKYEREFLLGDYPGTIDDYSEMVIQYGYITLFAASFPLSPILALACDLIELRSDAFKFAALTNKPFYQGAAGIGGWEMVLEVMGVIAVITNCLLIGYTFDSVHLLVGDIYPTFVVIVLLEHILLFIKFVIAVAIPDVPHYVRKLIARQKYIQDQLLKKFEAEQSEEGGQSPGRHGGGRRRKGRRRTMNPSIGGGGGPSY